MYICTNKKTNIHKYIYIYICHVPPPRFEVLQETGYCLSNAQVTNFIKQVHSTGFTSFTFELPMCFSELSLEHMFAKVLVHSESILPQVFSLPSEVRPDHEHTSNLGAKRTLQRMSSYEAIQSMFSVSDHQSQASSSSQIHVSATEPNPCVDNQSSMNLGTQRQLKKMNSKEAVRALFV